MANTDYKSIDEYISVFSPEVQALLQQVRQIIRSEAPEGVEAISYQIPTIKLNGKFIVYFAGWKSHISLYPIPPANSSLQKQMEPFIKSKGTLQFPLDKKLPATLIRRIVQAHLKRLAKKK